MESEAKHLKRTRVCSLVCCTNPQNRNTSLQDTCWKKSYAAGVLCFRVDESLLIFFIKEVVALGIIKLEIHCNVSVKIEAYHAKVYVLSFHLDQGLQKLA